MKVSRKKLLVSLLILGVITGLASALFLVVYKPLFVSTNTIQNDSKSVESDVVQNQSQMPNTSEKIIATNRLNVTTLEAPANFMENSDVMPDLDMHAFASDGAHVGLNYETGEYENKISGAEVSGDLWQDSEYIFWPRDITVCAAVTMKNLVPFLKAHPEAREKLQNSDIYNLEVVEYDETGQKQVLGSHNQILDLDKPAVPEEIGGTVQIFDIFAPTTNIEIISGGSSVDGAIEPGSIIALKAADDNICVGILRVEFSFDGENWHKYSDPLTIQNGPSNVFYYRSIDRVGNIEEDKKINIHITQF